jgi:hypothetical protein
MTAGTGDVTTDPRGQGERILCDITELVKGMQCQDCGVSFSCKHRGEPTGDCYSPKVHGSDCLLGATDCAECEANPNPTKQGDKPQPQGAPVESDYKAVPEMRGNEQIGVTFERKAPAPAPKVTDASSFDSMANAWLAVYRLCEELGYKSVDTGCGRDNICAFIRTLAQRAGEGYVRGVNDACAILDKQKLPDDSDITWRPDCPKGFAKQIRKELNIKAVTTRVDTRPDRGMGEK